MMGAQRADSANSQPDTGTDTLTELDWLGPPAAEEWSEPESPPMSRGAKSLGVLLALLALGWIGFAGWTLWRASPVPTPLEIAIGIALVSAPLILIGLVWLIFGKTTRRETERFTRAVNAMRSESTALETILQIVTARLEDSHSRLSDEAAKLMALGDEASDRLGRVAHYLSKQTESLDKKSEQLENAANGARVDIGVLLHDLPRAEEQARAVAEAMKDASFTAHAETGQLESQLSALVARGREADEVVGGAAQRLAAHLARIQSSTVTAATQLDEAATSMTSAVDQTMARTAEAVDAARASLEAQGQGMLAMIEHSRAALEEAGDTSGRHLAQRLESVSSQIQNLASHLAAQDAASQTLVARLGKGLADLDQRFAELGRSGSASSEQLAGSIAHVREAVQHLHSEIGGGHDRAAELIGRANEMAEALAGITGQLQGDIPAALARVEEQAGQTRVATESLAPMVEIIQVGALDAATQIAAAEASIARQQSALDALLDQMRSHVAGIEEQLRSLEETTAGADAAAGRMANDTRPQLIEALVRVREAANQAAERARETIAAVIPQASSQLGEASRQAVSEAIGDTVGQQMSELTLLSERAVEAARQASERLTRQMLTIGESAAAVEARIDAARESREEQDAQGFSRRVALLIESLNSTAIDVTKILSNEVTDSEWSAYLKGDRGVFTRRAVRLLDNAETREIARHYQSDQEFREQVNRYIHDFEAMLRRVLNEREGHALSVTILSSDMGKLYVALAQAIERLR
ncbi:MAG TPA: hypothetical protein VGR19_09010 [Allosphingosinicella sp.]|nr:hypothetical protein [Allosphingosinicella sp.]